MDITAAHSFSGGGSMTIQTASTISISAAVTFNIPVAFQAATLTVCLCLHACGLGAWVWAGCVNTLGT